MTRRRQVVISLVLTAMAVAIALFPALRTPHEVSFHGQPVEYWFTELPVTPIPPPGVDSANVVGFMNVGGQQYGSTALGDTGAIEALQFFGTNAVPLLLRKLQERDSIVEQKMTQVAAKAGINSLPFRKADLERYQAVTGLIRMKTLPPDALQLISTLSTNSYPAVASAAAYVLKCRAALSAAERGPRNR